MQAGELVEPYEEKAHFLVTKSHVDRSWDKQQKEWFEAYAYARNFFSTFSRCLADPPLSPATL
jgi:hypothetical protein